MRIPEENDLFRRRIEKSRKAREAREKETSARIAARVAHLEFEADTRRWAERMRFDLYLTAGDILTRLERIRDGNIPGAGEEWNEDFRTAVELIPAARALLEETGIRCMDRTEG